MSIKRNNIKYPYAYMYVFLTAICLIVSLVYIYINGGASISKWLFDDPWDTGNDFFNCIPAVKGYGLGAWLVGMYPPLAKLFFLFVAHIYSHNNIPLDITIRNSMTDPRMQQAALVPFVVFILVTSISIISLVSRMFEGEKHVIAIGASVLGTYSILFAIERGNVIYLAIMFLLYFIVFYRSENQILRETALISLSLSAGLKLYPAAFGILLLYEKRWKEAIRTIIYGILSLFVPYVLTRKYLPEIEPTTNGIMEWVSVCVNNLFGARSKQQQIFIAVSVIVALIGVVAIGNKNRKHWISTFYAGVLAIICGVQFSFAYSYAFLIPALVIFLKEEKISIKGNIYFLLISIINLPLPIFGNTTYARLPLVGEVKMWALFITVMLVTLFELPVWEKVKGGKE